MSASTNTYLSHLITTINQRLEVVNSSLLYGENINFGSRLSGLARGINPSVKHTILNVGNAELTHVGIGMGIMLDGGNAVMFVKQSDFLLLGLDQIVNTYNYIRAYSDRAKIGSFTIYSIICDQGYQGPQSSLNSPYDFSSLANISTYCLNGAADSNWVIQNQFINPGFRLVFVSQHQFNTESNLSIPISHSSDGSIFHYHAGNEATIICSGFGLRHGLQLVNALELKGSSIDLFHVNYVPGIILEDILLSCARTGKLIIMDDSKSVNKLGDLIVSTAKEKGIEFKLTVQGRRGISDHEYGVNIDAFTPNIDWLTTFVHS